MIFEEDGIRFFVPVTEPPRLFVDRADRDALGGYGLQGPRTRSEVAGQHLILESSPRVVVYDDTGWSAEAHVEIRVDENDDLDPQHFVARVDDR